MKARLATLLAAIVAIASATQGFAQTTLCADGQCGWISSIDYLSWAVRTPATQYAITDIGGVQDRGPVGDILAVGGDYDSGYRFALGRRFAAGPEVLFRYTDFENSLFESHTGAVRAMFVSSDNSENNDSDNTVGVETVTPEDRATFASGSLFFDYNVYDMELAQTLRLRDDLSLRLSGGGKAAAIDQAFAVRYTGGDFQTAFNANRASSYRGGGINLGGDLIWYLFPSLSVNVGTDMAMMLGSFENSVFIPDDEPGVPTSVTYRETRMTPVLGLSASFSYQREIGRSLITLSSGYEMTNWFNLNDERVFSDSFMEAQNSHLVNDVSLDGAFVSIGILR